MGRLDPLAGPTDIGEEGEALRGGAAIDHRLDLGVGELAAAADGCPRHLRRHHRTVGVEVDGPERGGPVLAREQAGGALAEDGGVQRSEEHTSELQSLMRISYARLCLK